jgi:protein-S-isoprenylcysteine O-methyltransferase Ste14
MVLHAIIDAVKLYAQKENNKSNWFLIDQLAHGLSILGLWVFFFEPEINLNLIQSSPKIWIYATAILLITVVSGIVMRELMSSWSKTLEDRHDASSNNAGKYIGMLERLFVFVFVITGNWEGIGFLLAAKSVFRFGDLKESKDRKLTEYILIGTLLSFGIAIAVGMLVIKLLEHV